MRRKLVSTWPVFFVIAMLMFAGSSSVTAEVPQFHSAGSLGGVRLMNASSGLELTGPDGGNFTDATAVVFVAVVAAASTFLGGVAEIQVVVVATSTSTGATNRSLSPGVAPVTQDEAAQITVEAFD